MVEEIEQAETENFIKEGSKIPICWIAGGCSYSLIKNPEWKAIAKKIDRQMIIRSSPQMRAMLLVSSLSYGDSPKEVCRMIVAANQSILSEAECYHYYVQVLWLTYHQVTSAKTRARIALALDMAREGQLRLLHSQEYNAEEIMVGKTGHRETRDFVELCYNILTMGAYNYLATKVSSACPDWKEIEEALADFKKETSSCLC